MIISGQQPNFILNALFNQDRTAIDVIDAVSKATKGKVKISVGSIYTQLARLEKAGLVKGHYGDEKPPERGGRPRRYYRITAAGSRALTQQDTVRNWGTRQC